jgi:hypothetical protein
VGVTGILAVYCFFKGTAGRKKGYVKRGFLLTGSAFIAGVVIIAYLYTNKLRSGYATGMERSPITEHPLMLFMQLCKACVVEIRNVFHSFFVMSYGMTIIACMAGVICCFYFFHRPFKRYISARAVSFLVIGLLYWCSIVAMRFSAAFDGFNFRLLFPASSLFFMGIISIILKYKDAWAYKINSGFLKYILLMVVLASLFSYPMSSIYRAARMFYKYKHIESINGYANIRAGILKELSSVPSGSLVITNSGYRESYVNFMRPDLLMVSPAWPLRIEQIQKIDQADRVYIYLDWENLPSGDTFFTQYRKGDVKLIQIK